MQWKGRGKKKAFVLILAVQSRWEVGGIFVATCSLFCIALHPSCEVAFSSKLRIPRPSPSPLPDFPCYFWCHTEPADPFCSPSGALTSHCKLPSPLPLALDAFQTPAGVQRTVLGKSPIVPLILVPAPSEWQGNHCSSWGTWLSLEQQTCMRASHPFAAQCSLTRIKRIPSVWFVSSYCFLKKQTNGVLLDCSKS